MTINNGFFAISVNKDPGSINHDHRSCSIRLWATYYGVICMIWWCRWIPIQMEIWLLSVKHSPQTTFQHRDFQSTFGGNGDAFISKFTADGTLLWCTYYGGTVEKPHLLVRCYWRINLYHVIILPIIFQLVIQETRIQRWCSVNFT